MIRSKLTMLDYANQFYRKKLREKLKEQQDVFFTESFKCDLCGTFGVHFCKRSIVGPSSK